MKKNNIALITALYDSNGADLYKEIYFPIIKYSVTKSVLDSKDNCKFGDLSGLKDQISDTFGVQIPLIVLRQSIRAMAKTNNDVVISLYGKDNYFKVEKSWSLETKEDIDAKADSIKSAFHKLSLTFTSFLEFNQLTCEKSLVDLINSCSADSAKLLEDEKQDGVSEEFAIIARFIKWTKECDGDSYTLIEQIIWAALVSGFLKRSNADWDVKVAEKTVYYLDTSLILGILGLSSVESVNYSRDLLEHIKSVGACPCIHPMTQNEILHILQSVEQEQGPRPGSAMEYAFASGVELHDITLKRKHLLETLERDYGISHVPSMKESEVSDKLKKYLVNDRVREFYAIRESKSVDMYSEAHDIYMSDYVIEMNRAHGLAEKYGYYFVTTNSGLIDFVRPSSGAPSVISSGQVIMNLWLHNAKSSVIKKAVLTELMSRCFAFNQTSARRRLRSFTQNYKNLDLSKEDVAALYSALLDRSNKTIRMIDEVNDLKDNGDMSAEENLLKAKEVVKIVYAEVEKRKLRDQEESQRNERLKSDIFQLQQEIETLNESHNSTKGLVESLNEQLKVSEETKQEYKTEIDRYAKERDLIVAISELDKEISVLDTKATNAISYVKFWVVLCFEVAVILIAIALIVLWIISLVCETSDLGVWLKSLGFAFVVSLITLSTHAKSLYLLAPRVARNHIRKEQLNTWIERHEDYKNLLKKKEQLQRDLDKVTSV